MSANSDRRKAMQARNAMQGVRPADVAAARALQASDPDVLQALVSGVVGMCSARGSDPDVMAYAGGIVARLWQARRNEAPIPAVVAYAVRLAEQSLFLAGWDDETAGDMTDMAVLVGARFREGDERTTLSHYGTAPADADYSPTYADAVSAAIATAPAGERVTLQRIADEWLAHERSECCSGAGRRVTLKGITAHAEGWTTADSAFHSSRRAAITALKRVDREQALMTSGNPSARPTYGNNGVSVGNNSPAHEAPAVWAPVAPREVPAVTVTRVESRATDYVWVGGGDFRVTVWDNAAGAVRRVVDAHPRPLSTETEVHAVAFPAVDSLGYPARLGYGAMIDPAPVGWVPVSWEETTRVVHVPAVTLPGRPVMFGPSRIVSRDANGVESVRPLTDAERALLAAPREARDVMREEDNVGDTASRDEYLPFDFRSPASVPSGHAVTPGDAVKSGKVPVSPRKRAAGNTGPTVPARLSR